ncbi:hypothetical protein [Streptococcus pneumoniae]|uniref:hypothetical protein n=1 Tax=Streptococcus pneumoniae TaxID=1313 RepID=UPI0005E2E80E|nr:hypothetical protein [Streptococcus pneumoniae]CJF78548.1 chlorohydrolase [Streptococcus pneumoniae]
MKLTKSAQNIVLRLQIELTKCSKHSFEVVDKTDEVSSKHRFEVADRTDEGSKHCFEVADRTDEVSNHTYSKATLTWFEEYYCPYF